MKILARAKTLRWLDSHSVQYDPHYNVNEGFVFAPEGNSALMVEAPATNARWNLLFAQELARWLPDVEVLLWITYWNTTPTEQYEYFAAWRLTHGESRRLIDAPGYIFRLGEGDDRWLLSQYMSQLIEFNWQGFVVQPSGPDIIWLADEIVELSLHDPTTCDKLAARLELLGIEMREPT